VFNDFPFERLLNDAKDKISRDNAESSNNSANRELRPDLKYSLFKFNVFLQIPCVPQLQSGFSKKCANSLPEIHIARDRHEDLT
jgi:hypothetical protein